MSEPIVVLGSGGHAKVVIEAIRQAGFFEIVACLDDAPERLQIDVAGIQVQGDISEMSLQRLGVRKAIIAVGSNAARRAIMARLDQAVSWVSVVHPCAWVAESAIVEPGAVIMAGSIVQPDAYIGAHAILNTACSVDHDCRIAAFAHVGPGAHLAGAVAIGEGAFLGTGVAVIPGLAIGEWSVIGAGATVVEDIPSRVTAVGTPARVIRSNPRK